MVKNLLLICFVALVIASTHAQAETSSNLDGQWIVDPKATEDFVKGTPRPPHPDKLAQWFGIAGGYLAIFIYEFKGNVALKSTLGPGDQALEYQQVFKQGAEAKYMTKQTLGSKADKFSVLIMDNVNIRIIPSESPEMGYVLWKRSQVQSKQMKDQEIIARGEEWMASIENIIKVMKKDPLTHH